MERSVPFVALDRQHAALGVELRDAIARVLASTSFVLGPELEGFEREFADYCGVGHCVGVASGTAALTIGLMAAGIGEGDEVIVPGYTFAASALAVVHAGASPVFCDVDEPSGLIDPVLAAAAVSPRTAAIMAVHLYGQVCDMDALGSLARTHGLLLLEDAAQAHGARFRGRRAGALADLAAFSFYPSKNLGALGDGGAICTDDVEIARRARELRDLGRGVSGEHVALGFNERLDELQAACLRVKLPHLNRWNAERRRHARHYGSALGHELGLLPDRPGTEPVYHLFPVRAPARDQLARALADHAVQHGIHYARTVPDHPAFAHVPVASVRVQLPVAHRWAREELSLPMFAELSDSHLERVIGACLSASSPRRTTGVLRAIP